MLLFMYICIYVMYLFIGKFMDPKKSAHDTRDAYDVIVREVEEAFQGLLDA